MATTSTKIQSIESMGGNETAPVNGQLMHSNGTAIIPALEVVQRLDAPDDGRYVSHEEYWDTWYNHIDASYEWNNGYLEAKPLTTKVQYYLFKWFLMLLFEYEKTVQNVDVMGLETGFTMHVPNPRNPGMLKKVTRKPDVAVIRHDNPNQWGDHEHSYKGICNVCVESLSDSAPSEIMRDIITKYAEYAYSGVQEYYILDPDGRHMHFYRRTGVGTYVEIVPTVDGVIRSNELPGFQFRIRDLFRQPSLEELAQDEVYQGYVLPDYQAVQKRAEAERQRAEEAEGREEQQRQRAERYEAIIRELGISLDD